MYKGFDSVNFILFRNLGKKRIENIAMKVTSAVVQDLRRSLTLVLNLAHIHLGVVQSQDLYLGPYHARGPNLFQNLDPDRQTVVEYTFLRSVKLECPSLNPDTQRDQRKGARSHEEYREKIGTEIFQELLKSIVGHRALDIVHVLRKGVDSHEGIGSGVIFREIDVIKREKMRDEEIMMVKIESDQRTTAG